MRWAAHLLPQNQLEGRYPLEQDAAWLSGLWVDDALISDWAPQRVIEQLGLDFVAADGIRPFDQPHTLGLLRFPLTESLAAASCIDASVGFGGVLPDPSPMARWTGSGFAPGGHLIPEYRISRQPVPDEAELMTWTRGGRMRAARRRQGRWVR